MFIVDVGHEDIAVAEARKLNIPVVAIVDSNNPPDGVDYVIPGNDDALRAIQLYTQAVAEAIETGKSMIPGGGSSDEFVEVDESGRPTQSAGKKKASAKKAAGKKTAAAKTASTATERGEGESAEAAEADEADEAAAAEADTAGEAAPASKKKAAAKKTAAKKTASKKKASSKKAASKKTAASKTAEGDEEA
jgi:small subunit ribosomal protein S2